MRKNSIFLYCNFIKPNVGFKLFLVVLLVSYCNLINVFLNYLYQHWRLVIYICIFVVNLCERLIFYMI